jgi:hypothetical protein
MSSLRSREVAIEPIRNPRTGTTSYRVTGTIHHKQRKRQFMNLADAEAVRDAWERERIGGAAAMRSKYTRLTQAQLDEAESCFEFIKADGYTLLEVVKTFLRNPPATICKLTFDEAYKQFLTARQPYISRTQYGNYEGPCRRLSAFLGHNRSTTIRIQQ